MKKKNPFWLNFGFAILFTTVIYGINLLLFLIHFCFHLKFEKKNKFDNEIESEFQVLCEIFTVFFLKEKIKKNGKRKYLINFIQISRAKQQ
jgi:hypothetical protein